MGICIQYFVTVRKKCWAIACEEKKHLFNTNYYYYYFIYSDNFSIWNRFFNYIQTSTKLHILMVYHGINIPGLLSSGLVYFFWRHWQNHEKTPSTVKESMFIIQLNISILMGSSLGYDPQIHYRAYVCIPL